MKTAKLLNVSLMLGILSMFIGMTIFTTLAAADDGEAVEVQTTQAETTDTQSGTEEQAEGVSTETYTYVAQPGDSYTKMARKATQTYGIQTGTSLSGAQIVFVETNLTRAAGSPELSLGQEVVIQQSLVNEWVEKAGQLTESQTAAWQEYADTVDFNTNAVGEVSEN